MYRWNRLTKVKEFRLKMYPKNFNQERHFYEKILEFPVIKEWDRGEEDQGVMFDTGNGIVELLTPENEYAPISGCDVSLEVSDVWELWKKFDGSDNIIFPIRDNDWGDTSFCIADPEGFEITFFSKISV